MINAEHIYHKAQSLDALRLQELADFLDFLLTRKQVVMKQNSPFPDTRLEPVDMPSVYQGKSLSSEEMNQAVEWEAGQRS